MYLFCDLV